eukprot:TRINITY_DN2010_c0_g1_i1.p2 TRINITY_DN2010_c0_g1~~TRINITY_DN2010_c0_g1_i1.p2  ORF type:complete len:209 (+),score=36.00 TRINITY_DN2010_c0_g1_i1:26-628(+)
MTISGLFEIHITTHRANDVEAFRAACAALALKPVLIQLPAGEHATQLMTSSYVSGSLDKAAAQARQQADALQAAGFPASRVKVEAMISNAGVPDTAADAQASIAESAGRYFEFHLKIAMRPGDYDAVNAVWSGVRTCTCCALAHISAPLLQPRARSQACAQRLQATHRHRGRLHLDAACRQSQRSASGTCGARGAAESPD